MRRCELLKRGRSCAGTDGVAARALDAGSGRASDEELLDAMSRVAAGEPVRHVAARLGWLSGDVLAAEIAAVERDFAKSEGRADSETPAPAGAAVCPVPGCGSALSSGNRSGVCRRHNHAHLFCRCPRCRP